MHRMNLLCPADLPGVLPEAPLEELIAMERENLTLDFPSPVVLDLSKFADTPDILDHLTTFVSRPVKSYNAYHYR